MLKHQKLKAEQTMDITETEHKAITKWVQDSAQPDLVRKMQDDTTDLSHLGIELREDYFKVDAPFRDQVHAYKDYFSMYKLSAGGNFGLLNFMHRGGMGNTDVNRYLSGKYEAPFVNEAPFYRALIEAQTGFFDISDTEFHTMKMGPLPSTQLRDKEVNARPEDKQAGRTCWDRYKTINDTMPREALQKVTFVEFKELVAEALREKGLIIEGAAKYEPYKPAPLSTLVPDRQSQRVTITAEDAARIRGR